MYNIGPPQGTTYPKSIDELYGGALTKPRYPVAFSRTIKNAVGEVFGRSKTELDLKIAQYWDVSLGHVNMAKEIIAKQKERLKRLDELQGRNDDKSMEEAYLLRSEITSRENLWGLGYNVSNAWASIDQAKNMIRIQTDWDRQRIAQDYGNAGVQAYNEMMFPVVKEYEERLSALSSMARELPMITNY
jgi:hypothetical protein